MSNMHNPAHPGEVLREYLPEGVSIGEVAKRLEGALGTSAEMWLNMQTNHDLWHARKRPPRVQRISASTKAA